MEKILCKICGTEMKREKIQLSQHPSNYYETVGGTSVPTGEVTVKRNSQKPVPEYLQYICPSCGDKDYIKS